MTEDNNIPVSTLPRTVPMIRANAAGTSIVAVTTWSGRESRFRPAPSLLSLAGGFSVSGADLSAPLGDTTLGEALLAPTTIYAKQLLNLHQSVRVKALSHITGGGLLENLPRVLPEGCRAVIDTNSWDWPAVFDWLREAGGVDTREMYRTFNCGVGMVLCIAADDLQATLDNLGASGLQAWQIGRIEAGDNEVELA